ncbi:kinesin-like protein KIF17 isoform X3 [Falco peregrinus]|uniref:kinesin-like protein KIF17 isoform X3 n=1 Tax=Falco peregrinus TaxID=8954 RepID=UPI00247B1AB4|nr:kinesin-like protein KIF17 isoform X3 [Falco peregrinus]
MASEAVKVIVRCRPMNEREKALGCKAVVSMESTRGQCFLQNPTAAREPPKQFTFDGVYYQEHNTEQIYNEIAYPLVEGVTEGYNGTIFAYGQTGSGKSFTMQGVVDPSTQKGIIPRAFEHIFESVQCAENTKFLVRVSYLEIYNEDIRDLLGADTKQKLELKEHPEKGVYVKGLSLHTVHSVVQCEQIMETGWRNRAVGYTLMNKDSSRSHSIFTVNMEIYTVGLLPAETAHLAEKPAPLKPQLDLEAEKQLIREEYEEKLAQLKASYEAEQASRARLEEDISSLRHHYNLKLSALEENLRKEAAAVRTETTPDMTPLPVDATAGEGPTSAQGPEALRTVPDACGVSRGSAGAEGAGAEGIALPADQQQVLARLQMLEQQVVGGEQAKNKDLKEKHKRRKKYADERRMQLVAALQQSNEDSSDWVLLNVYDSIQEEVRAKSKLLEKMQEKLRAAETEIKDLQSEFELEKIDYLSTIRRLERDVMLFQQLLDQVQSLVRRDCNYSNLEKVKCESVWDEETGCWKIPEPVIQKTRLPAAVPALPEPTPARRSPPAQRGEPAVRRGSLLFSIPIYPISAPCAADAVARSQPEQDRYKLVLSRSGSEAIASSYFRAPPARGTLRPPGEPVPSRTLLPPLRFPRGARQAGHLASAGPARRMRPLLASRGGTHRAPPLFSYSHPGAAGGSGGRLPPAPALPPAGPGPGPAAHRRQAPQGQSRRWPPPALTAPRPGLRLRGTAPHLAGFAARGSRSAAGRAGSRRVVSRPVTPNKRSDSAILGSVPAPGRGGSGPGRAGPRRHLPYGGRAGSGRPPGDWAAARSWPPLVGRRGCGAWR